MFIAFNILKLVSDNSNKKIIIFLGKGHVQSINELLSNKPIMQRFECKEVKNE
jgi:pheromone shutdown protein TraB